MSLERFDEIQHRWKKIHEGDIDYVDFYKYEGAHKFKWRSRLPEDPEFQNQRIQYRLRYIISGKILKHENNEYNLSDDFLFPDRDGTVEYFRGEFSADPVWMYGGTKKNPDTEFRLIDVMPVVVQNSNVRPGNAEHIDLIFRFAGETLPEAQELTTDREYGILSSSFFAILFFSFLGFIYGNTGGVALSPFRSFSIWMKVILKNMSWT